MKPEDLPPPPKSRVGLYVILGLFALALLAVGAWFGYQWYKNYRAENLAAEARSTFEEGHYVEAWEKARTAYLLSPGRLPVLRALAEVAEVRDPRQAVEHWREAVEKSGAREDRVALAWAGFRSGEYELVREQLDALGPDPKESRALLLLSRLRLREDNLPKAIQLAEKAAAAPEAEDSAHLYFVQLTQLSPRAEIRQKGLDYLKEKAVGEDSLSLSALRNLARLTARPEEEMRDTYDRLRAHPLAAPEDRLLALGAAHVAGIFAREELAGKAREMVNLEDPAELAALGRWYNQMEMPAQVEAQIGAELALSRQDLFLVRMDALAKQGKWAQVAVELDKPSAPIPAHLRYLFLARSALQRGEKSRADLHWQEALVQARRGRQDQIVERLRDLYQYVQRLGVEDYQRDVLELLATQPMARRQAYTQLIEMEKGQGNTSKLRELYEEMARYYPRDPEVRNDLLWLRLLAGHEVDVSTKAARELYEEHPAFLAHRMTYALGLLRQGRAEEALAFLREAGELDWGAAAPRWRLIAAAVLDRAGETQMAAGFLGSVNPDDLLPKERELYERLRAGEPPFATRD